MPSPRPGFRAWATLGVLLLLTVLSFLDRTIIALLVDPLKRDLHLSDVQISLLQGVTFALFYAAFSLPMGWLSDRVSRRALIFVGVSLWSIATAACGFAGTFWHLCIARFFVGIGEATLAPAGLALLPELFPRRRLALATGILGTGAGLGASLAYMIGGAIIGWTEWIGGISLPLLGDVRSWQLVFLLVGLPGLPLALLIFVTPKQASMPPAAAVGAVAPGYGAWFVRHWPYVFSIMLGLGAFVAFSNAVAAWTPSFMVRVHGLDIVQASMLLGSIQIVCLSIGFVGTGWLCDRINAAGWPDANFRIMIATCGVLATTGVSAFLVRDSDMFLIFYALFNLFLPITAPAYSHIQAHVPPAFRGRTLAIVMAGMHFGGLMLGPASVAVLTEKLFGDPKAIGMAIAITIAVFAPLGGLAFALGKRFARRLAAETAQEMPVGPAVTGLSHPTPDHAAA